MNQGRLQRFRVMGLVEIGRLGAEGSGQRQNIDLLRSRLQQDSGALLDRRSGGEHIVDKQDMFLSDYLRSADFEGTAYILLSLRA